MGTPGYFPYADPAAPVVPPPPRLHWAWVLVLSALTRSLFGAVWLLVQAVWVRKATGRTAPQAWATAHLCSFPLIFLGGLLAGAASARSGMDADSFRYLLLGLQVVCGLAIAVLYLVTVYKVRAALEEPPVGIPLGGAMTFFFGAVYFQYFLRDWAPTSYSMASPYPQYTYPNVPPQA